MGLSEQEISNYDFQVQQFGQTKLSSFLAGKDYSLFQKKQGRAPENKNNFWFDQIR